MTSPSYHLPDLSRRAFARTNPQTVMQRAAIVQELLPHTIAIGEICCGDCSIQAAVYQQIGIQRYCGLDSSQRS